MTTETVTPPALDAPADAAPAATPTPTYGLLGLVFSIVSIPTGMGVFAIAGIVLGFLGRQKEAANRNLADWALIVGFLSLFWWVGLAVLAAGFLLPVIFTGAWIAAF